MGHFLVHLRHAYRASNTYHNFQHALDVFQATYMYLRAAGALPPVAVLRSPEHLRWRPDPGKLSPLVGILRNEDLFALCIAAVGHDVGHPGFNNAFMVRSPFLSQDERSLTILFITCQYAVLFSFSQLHNPRKMHKRRSRKSTTTSRRSSRCTSRSCCRS